MYLKRASGLFELIACTFSVMLSIVRFIKGGILTCEGSIVASGPLRLWEAFKQLGCAIEDRP